MKRILILTRFAKEYEPKRLAEEGRKSGNNVDIVKYGQINLSIVGGKPKIDLGKKRLLENYDLIIPRAASKKSDSMISVKTAILQTAKRKGISVLNGESFANYPLLGKIEQSLLLAEAGLPVPPMTTFGSKKGWQKYLSTKINFPVIVKGRFGSHGRTVKLVKNRSELEKLIRLYSSGNILIQGAMPIKQWYRCIVAGRKYLGAMRHRQKEKYLSAAWRIKLLAETLIKLNSKKMDQLKDICLKAINLFDCEYAGIDVGWNEETKSWVIFEVNRTAQFKYFEKRTGVNVAKAMIDL